MKELSLVSQKMTHDDLPAHKKVIDKDFLLSCKCACIKYDDRLEQAK